MCPNCPEFDECAHEVPEEDFSMMNFLYIEVMRLLLLNVLNISTVLLFVPSFPTIFWDPITIRREFDINSTSSTEVSDQRCGGGPCALTP